MLRILPGRSTGPGFIAGALSFAVAVAWIPWLEDSPDADVPRYTLLMLAACAGLWMPFRPKAEHWLGLAFIAWAAVSLAWTTGIHDGMGFLVKFLMLAGLFAVGNGMPSLKPVYAGLGLGFAVNSGFVIVQYFGWHPVLEGAGPGGLFMAKNYVAEPAALVLVGLWGCWYDEPYSTKKTLWLALMLAVLPCVAMTNARGAALAIGVAALGVVWRSSRLSAIGLFLAAVVTIGSMAYIKHDFPAQQRLQIWYSTAIGFTPLGSGLGSFYTRFPSHALDYNNMVDRPTHAHNDFIEVAYELGPGVLLYLVFLGWVLCGIGTERLVVLAFITEQAFGFPLYFPVPSALFALAAGQLVRSRAPVRVGAYLRANRIYRSACAWCAARRGAGDAAPGQDGIPVRS